MPRSRTRRTEPASETVGAIKTLQELPRAIRKGEIRPVYLIYGTEQYLLDRLLKETIDALLPVDAPMSRFNLDTLDGSVAQLEEVATAARTMPMGADRRVIVVKEPAFLGGGVEPGPIKRLRQCAEAYASGNHTRAFHLFFRALDLDPAPLDAPEVRTKIAAVRPEVAAQDAALLPYLDDAASLFGHVPLPKASGSTARERFLDWLPQLEGGATVLVLVVQGTPDKKVLRAIQERGVLANVDSLTEQGRRGRDPVALFVNKQLKAAGCEIEPEALRLFRARTQDDLQTIVDELEKVVAYVGERATIGVDDVRAAVSDGSSVTVFDLTDAIARRDLRQALHSLHQVLVRGEPPLKVHALFVRQVRLMVQAQLLQEAGLLTGFSPGMSYRAFMNLIHRKWPQEAVGLLPANASLNLLKQKPYAMYQILRHAANFTLAELLDAYDLLLSADEALKSSAAPDSAILQNTVAEIVQAHPLPVGRLSSEQIETELIR